MSSPRDDERDPPEGVRFELPFFSFRMGQAGWGWNVGMYEDDSYQRARRRVRARLGLYRHLATYAAVMAAVALIDLVTGGGISDPALWLAGVWGAFLVWQAFNVFVFPSVWSKETEERMIQEEMRREQTQQTAQTIDPEPSEPAAAPQQDGEVSRPPVDVVEPEPEETPESDQRQNVED